MKPAVKEETDEEPWGMSWHLHNINKFVIWIETPAQKL